MNTCYIYEDVGGKVNFGNIDRHGKPQLRNCHDYPYAYSEFVIYRGGKNEEIQNSAHSDRMLGRDYDKLRNSVKKVFKDQVVGDYYARQNPDKVEEVLRIYFDKPNLKLILIEEMCNVSNGYPLWLFSWKE